jgi:hypothetical protein
MQKLCGLVVLTLGFMGCASPGDVMVAASNTVLDGTQQVRLDVAALNAGVLSGDNAAQERVLSTLKSDVKKKLVANLTPEQAEVVATFVADQMRIQIGVIVEEEKRRGVITARIADNLNYIDEVMVKLADFGIFTSDVSAQYKRLMQDMARNAAAKRARQTPTTGVGQ